MGKENRTEKSIWYHSQHLFSVKETGTVLEYSCWITLSGPMHVSSFGYILAGPGPLSNLFLFSYLFLLSSIRRDWRCPGGHCIYIVVAENTFLSLSGKNELTSPAKKLLGRFFFKVTRNVRISLVQGLM